ncbi:allophanate hydrolase subunit 2-domain-containing protein [Clohesyomyces aquaticus]|uniref:Allophanate hydrolase subunit 2-domain-containing protein n=1 Tax=Clohesyomyces aquaticus TaxID=1231657 RepID=A0A1Y2A427_9PLEO|nr:allophanate hydrolase subunit 2-domain-containing protein [Clohesyomyces aquaticus]
MEKLRTLLVANRGEIAVRICKTAKKLNIKTIAIYSDADSASQHVREADEAVLLAGSNSTAYTDEKNIIDIAKEKKADGIIPGYGFLSENPHFARLVGEAGIVWVGPSPEVIDEFGIKHVARGLAEKASVPIVPGTKGLVDDEDAAAKAAEDIGFPVMLKATGGGGGMGLVTCNTAKEVCDGFKTVQSRGKTLFKNSGVFIERYYPASHHIEVQVFGNGQGQAIHFGERECSIQRRHQKVIEECPSPFVEKYPELRKKLGDAAVQLAESIKYGSAGTIEYLVDDESGDFFFLEMNTRLQVEHGITELCYGVDLVELMLKQADAQLTGKGGLDGTFLKNMLASGPSGAAIEARIYAENPLKDYAPSPGLLQKVEWKDVPGSRIDTWVFTGSRITPNYDPLIAKAMVHSSSRDEAVAGIKKLLTESSICGPPTNLEFLAEIMDDPKFKAGTTITNFLQTFKYVPHAIDVISPGAYTLIQDLPARPTVGKGIPHSGPMDPLAFQIANMLVGNPRGKEGLEITLNGPELRFLTATIVSLCGAPMETSLDGEEFPMWTKVRIEAGQKLKVGKTIGGGCRSYLAVFGGFPEVADYFGSKSTSPLVAIGGYQGRALAPGDLLRTAARLPDDFKPVSLPENLRPVYNSHWEIKAMVGPHDEGFLLPEDIEMIYDTKWKISHNASRSGIRLVGPVPKWARKDGGEGGAHPSNLIEFGYPLGTLNWTGDDPCIFPVDAPNFGGFVSSTTVIRAEWWKLGQLKAGNTLKYVRVGLKDALRKREKLNTFLDTVEHAIKSGERFDKIEKLQGCHVDFHEDDIGKAVVLEKECDGHIPRVRYRQGGDDHLIVEYGSENFDINHRCRVTALENALRSSSTPSHIKENLIDTVGCCTTLLVFYDGLALPRKGLLDHLQTIENRLGDLRSTKVPTRLFKLPITFESKAQTEATERYMTNQRPHAPYLPDNLAFVAKNNAFTPQQLKDIYLTGKLMAVEVGFFCGNTCSLPVDPRQRMSCPKMNPSRVFTPEGTVSWGGSCMSIYPVDSPGGYQMTGRTVPCWDYYGWKKGFSAGCPWLFKDFDILTFYQVSELEMDVLLLEFRTGKYEFQYEDVEFDMGEHNKLLEDTADEVKEVRKRQAAAQEEMVKAENESLERWRREKAENQVDEGTVEKLLEDPMIISVVAPVDANVWKVEVVEGKDVFEGTTIVVLEAMKLEIAVKTPDDVVAALKDAKVQVEKMLVKPGDTVQAGGHICLLRKE